MPSEVILFNEGLDFGERSCLQKPGFLATANNIVFEVDGKQTLRPSFSQVNQTPVELVHSIGIFRERILIGYGSTLAWNNGSGDFTTLFSQFTKDARWVFKEYKQFFHGVNGYESVLFDVDGNLYPAQIENPATSPTGADSGVAGNPNGVYKLYVSYYIAWPNGMVYETGLSEASADVSVSSKQITWSNIPICDYVAYSGVLPTIERRLYRGPGTGGALTGIYFVDTISDNTTTTYTDNFTDAEVAAGGLSAVADFGPLPNSKYLEYHYGRAFVIDTEKPWRLTYSEPASGDTAIENENIMPLSMEANDFDDIRVGGFQGIVNPQGILAWGQNLYIALNQTWLRKEGNDAVTWNYKKGFSSWGLAAPFTLSKGDHPVGLYGLSLFGDGEPGICIYNGMTAEALSATRLRDLLKADLNKSAIANCFGKNVGFYYHFLYPSGNNTTPDTYLAIDLTHFPDARIGNWTDLNAVCIAVDESNGDMFLGCSDGYVRKRSDTVTESINVDVQTRDLIGSDIKAANTIKVLKQLKYNLNTNGDPVKLEITIDGVLQTWQNGQTYYEISGTGDKVQVMESFPNNFEGYVYNLRVYGTVTAFELYSPWNIELDGKG